MLFTSRFAIIFSTTLGTFCVSSAIGLSACSSSAGGTSGTPAQEAGTGTDSSPPDAGVRIINSCTDFAERTYSDSPRSITWDISLSGRLERCMVIKKGQDVTFSGDFSTHPLLAEGGDSPNPIASHDATGKVTFRAAGLFGFRCGTHPSMTGTIWVAE